MHEPINYRWRVAHVNNSSALTVWPPDSRLMFADSLCFSWCKLKLPVRLNMVNAKNILNYSSFCFTGCSEFLTARPSLRSCSTSSSSFIPLTSGQASEWRPALTCGVVAGALQKMASPFVPVPVPFDRASPGGSGKLRRPPRASSLGSVSSSSDSSLTRAAGEDHNGQACGGLSSQRQSRCTERGTRSKTPPLHSPVTRARLNGGLDHSVEYSTCPRSMSDPVGSQQGEDRPITPTVLGYEVMEERAKFTVWRQNNPNTNFETWESIFGTTYKRFKVCKIIGWKLCPTFFWIVFLLGKAKYILHCT